MFASPETHLFDFFSIESEAGVESDGFAWPHRDGGKASQRRNT
jgi:hypothetical protein